MADTYNAKRASSSELDGWFKTKYGSIQKLCPTQFGLQRRMPFNEADRIGDKYSDVALLQNEHGVTYAAAGDDAFGLGDAIAGQTKPTEIQGSQHVMRTVVGINAIASAKKKGETAFGNTMDMVVSNANDSLRKRVEIDMFWGQDTYGIGRVSSTNGSTTITIAAAEWAPGVWAGAEGAVIDVRDAALTTDRGNLTITQVNMSTRTLTYADTLTSEAATDVLLFNGMYHDSTDTWKTQVGLNTALATASGALFGITVTESSLWKPCTYAVGSTQLTFQKVQKALYQVQSKGYKGDMVLIVNPNTWTDLLDDEVALRRHNEGGVKQYEVGANGIKFYTAIGTVTIESSIYCKEGWAFLVPDGKSAGSRWRRIGAADVGFDPIGDGGRWIERVAAVAAYEFRLYDNQAIYSGRPGFGCQLTGIVNSA